MYLSDLKSKVDAVAEQPFLILRKLNDFDITVPLNKTTESLSTDME